MRAPGGRTTTHRLGRLPWVVSAVAASYVWKWLYHSDFGVIGALFVQLGLSSEPINFIDNTTTSLYSLIVVNAQGRYLVDGARLEGAAGGDPLIAELSALSEAGLAARIRAGSRSIAGS